MNLDRPHPFVFSQAASNGKDKGVQSHILVIIRACSKAEAIQKFIRWRKESVRSDEGRPS